MKLLKNNLKFFKNILKTRDFSKTKKIFEKDIDSYLELSRLVKESREDKNITQEQLSNISKIPLTIIIAIEDNDKACIPEYPFLRSILIKIEECLFLQKFKLVDIVKDETNSKNDIKINYLTSKLDLITSWHGDLVYFFILLLCLLVLNNYYMNSKIIEFKFIENNNSKNEI